MKFRIMFLLFGMSLLFLSITNSTYKNYTLINSSIENDTVLWDSKILLKWEDFQGIPDEKSSYKALTSSLIRTKVHKYTRDLLEYEIYCAFEKKKSWVKKKTVTLLRHEQLHFDIAEVATRNMRRKFSEYKLLSSDSTNAMIDKIFNAAVLERRSLNQQYDNETKHSLNTEKQKEWENKITLELKKLNKYSSTRVVIKRKL